MDVTTGTTIEELTETFIEGLTASLIEELAAIAWCATWELATGSLPAREVGPDHFEFTELRASPADALGWEIGEVWWFASKDTAGLKARFEEASGYEATVLQDADTEGTTWAVLTTRPARNDG